MLKNISKMNLSIGSVSVVMALYFLYWGVEYTSSEHIILFVLATVFGLFMAFNIGGNDVANSFGTSVGAGTLTLKQALIVAAIFEVSGAIIAGGEVTETIRSGIVNLSSMHMQPLQFVYIMMSALLAAAIWLLFATKKGYPVSTTHSIVGGIVGSSIMLGILLDGYESAFALVQWGKIGSIALSWVISPVLGGTFAYALYWYIRKYILLYNEDAEKKLKEIKSEKKAHKKSHKKAYEKLSQLEQISYSIALSRDAHALTDPDFTDEDLECDYFKDLHKIENKKDEVRAFLALEVYVPIIAAIGAMIIAAMLIFKGLKNLNLGLTTLSSNLILLMIGASVWMTVYIFARTLKGKSLDRATFLLFSWMQVFTASGFAFSHGSNDIANAVGPFAAVLDVLRTGTIESSAPMPTIVMATFGVALVSGLWFLGKHVIATVGSDLTEMHPASGFSAELAAAGVTMSASAMGIPVSSTHILIGAVMGIGMANHQANWGLMKPIALAWVITLPAAAGLSALTYFILSTVFGS
jgi:PiT family inorganic phosphate transporter